MLWFLHGWKYLKTPSLVSSTRFATAHSIWRFRLRMNLDLLCRSPANEPSEAARIQSVIFQNTGGNTNLALLKHQCLGSGSGEYHTSTILSLPGAALKRPSQRLSVFRPTLPMRSGRPWDGSVFLTIRRKCIVYIFNSRPPVAPEPKHTTVRFCGGNASVHKSF